MILPRFPPGPLRTRERDRGKDRDISFGQFLQGILALTLLAGIDVVVIFDLGGIDEIEVAGGIDGVRQRPLGGEGPLAARQPSAAPGASLFSKQKILQFPGLKGVVECGGLFLLPVLLLLHTRSPRWPPAPMCGGIPVYENFGHYITDIRSPQHRISAVPFQELPHYLLQQLAFKESVDSGIMDCHRPPCYAFCVLIRNDFLRKEPSIKQ